MTHYGEIRGERFYRTPVKSRVAVRLLGGGVIEYDIPMPSYAVPQAQSTVEAVTNAYHTDGVATASWTARNNGDGVTLTNNLTGAIHELPKAAVEALLVLR